MSLEDDIKTEAYFYIDARGTIIKLPLTLASLSPVLEAWVNNWRKNPKEPFYVNYSTEDVHKTIDKLSSGLEDYLLLEGKNEEKNKDDKQKRADIFFDRCKQGKLYSSLYSDIEVDLKTTPDGFSYIVPYCTGYTLFKIVNKIYPIQLGNTKKWDIIKNPFSYTRIYNGSAGVNELKYCIIETILLNPELLAEIYGI
jgi:hypothetical protein